VVDPFSQLEAIDRFHLNVGHHDLEEALAALSLQTLQVQRRGFAACGH
jgi:hypothetical protein